MLTHIQTWAMRIVHIWKPAPYYKGNIHLFGTKF
jgi:hypothetical protein